MGQVLQGGAGQAPARQASIGAGLPIEVGSDTVNKVCASSIRAVEMADQMIRAGDHDVIVAGGMESMTNAPYALKKARYGYRLGDGTLIDLMIHDGLVSTFDKRHMVEQASFVSRELGIAREHAHPEALRVDLQVFEDELPGELDRAFLEVLAEREVAEHLEEGQVVRVEADLVDVRGAEALLHRGRGGRRRRLAAEEVRHLRLHPGAREQRRAVVCARDQRGRRAAQVALRLEEREVALAELGGRAHRADCRCGPRYDTKNTAAADTAGVGPGRG